MNKQAINDLEQLLDADSRELSFLKDVPDHAADQLAQAIQSKVELEFETLNEAIDTGVAALPIPLGVVAGNVLRQ